VGEYESLFEIRVSDLPKAAEGFADEVATGFRPRSLQRCRDRESALREEESKLEQLRERLAEEIQRVHREQAEQQRRKLELKVEQPPAR